MKTYGMIRLTLIVSFAFLMVIGCQPSRQKPVGSGVEVAPVQQAVQESSQQSKTGAQEAVDKDAPRLVITKDSHDFKEVGPGSSQNADYEFTNEGKKDLLVKNIQSTCGCSKPTLIKGDERFPMPLKQPVAFEPGQTGRVEVTFKAGVAKGSVSKHLFIISNDPKTPRGQLTVKATVVVKVDVTPEKVELRFDQENAGMPELTVKSADDTAFSIKSAFVANGVIKVPFDPEQEATEFTLKPEVDIEKLEQFNAGVLQITTTHPQAGTLMVRYNATPMYEITNPRYIIQNAEPGVSVFRDNLIKSNYGKTIEIESVISKNGYMEIESQVQDGDHIKLKIKITPPSQSTDAKRYITDELTITLKDGSKLPIRCSGWFRLK